MASRKTPAASAKGSMVQNVASLDPNNPIPLEHHSSSAFILKKHRRYIPFMEPHDRFGQLLLEGKLLSPTNFSCINSKTQYCIGSGWQLQDGVEDSELTKWARVVNRKGHSLNEVLKAGFDNYFTTGNSYIEVVRGKVGSTRYVRVYMNNFQDCRLSVPDDDDIVTSVYKSKEFRRSGIWTLKDDDYIEVPLYNANSFGGQWVTGPGGDEHTMFHLKHEVSGYDYYGMPSNVSCLPQQILEYKAARSNIDDFDNNLMIGGLIVLQGSMTQDEADQLGKNIVYQHTGDGKRGRWVILASNGNVDDAKVLPFESRKDGHFLELDKRGEEKILFANEWSRVLIDPLAGGMGNSGKQIKEIFEVKNNTIIKPMQSYMIDKVLYPIMEICDEWMGKTWSQNQFSIQTVAPLSFVGDLDVNSIMTVDEGRKAMGLPELGGEEGRKRIKSGPAQLQKKEEDINV